MRSEHEIAVFELGINKNAVKWHNWFRLQGQRQQLLRVLGMLIWEGSAESLISQQKREIFFHYLKKIILVLSMVINYCFSTIAYRHPVIKFGSKTTNQIQARKIRIESRSHLIHLKIVSRKI